MKTNKIFTTLASLLIAILIISSGSLLAQTVDKKSEDAKKKEAELKVKAKEEQEAADKPSFEVESQPKDQEKKKEETQKEVKETPPAIDPMKEKKKQEEELEKELEKKEKQAEGEKKKIHTLKEDQEKAAGGDVTGVDPDKAPETPSEETIEKAPPKTIKTQKEIRIKKEDVKKAQKQAQESVKQTENTINTTEEKISVAKEKVEEARLRVKERFKNGEITQEEYDEKMIKIEKVENMIIDLQNDLKADQEKITKTKVLVDTPQK